MDIFDFGKDETLIEREENIKNTWEDFRRQLADGHLVIDDVKDALNITFLHQFDDMFNNMHNNVTCNIYDIKGKFFIRGTILTDDEVPNYERMIPNSRYIKDDNRFSQAGVDWLYIAMGENENSAVECSKKECKTKKGDRFAFCNFEINERLKDIKIVDLTIADSLSSEIINNDLKTTFERMRKKTANRTRKLGIYVPPNVKDKKIIEDCVEQWFLKTYLKLISEQIFVPLERAIDRRLVYAPFQCLANYFISKGYDGIIYKSTVCEDGKNIVFFNKCAMHPTGDICIEMIRE